MFAFGGLELVVMPLALVGIVVLAIVALTGGRGDPDPRGRRAAMLYLCLVPFVAIFSLLYAVPSVVSAVANLTLVEVEDGGASAEVCAQDPLHPECRGGGVTQFINVFPSSREAQESAWARDAFNALAVGLAAAAVLRWHRSRWKEVADDDDFASSPGARTLDAYLYAVSFTAMIVLLAAAAVTLFALARVVAPDVVSAGSPAAERDAGLVQLLSAVATAGAAAFVYVTHWRRTAAAASRPAD